MYKSEYEIDNVISTHSFDWYQISVITMKNSENEKFKGIAIRPIPAKYYEEATDIDWSGSAGKPLVINKTQALQICEFAKKVLEGKLPQEVRIESGGLDIRIKLKKYTKKWHDGGAYKGKMGYGEFSFFGFLSSAKVSKKSLTKPRRNLNNLYELN